MTPGYLARYRCDNCAALYRSAVSHPALGPVCPICLRPVTASVRRRSRAKGRLEKIGIRDGWQCHLCKGPVEPRGKGVSAPSLDHLLPLSRGGSNTLDNLKLAHVGCNQKRGNALLEETA